MVANPSDQERIARRLRIPERVLRDYQELKRCELEEGTGTGPVVPGTPGTPPALQGEARWYTNQWYPLDSAWPELDSGPLERRAFERRSRERRASDRRHDERRRFERRGQDRRAGARRAEDNP